MDCGETPNCMTHYPFVADRRKVLWIAVCWSAGVFLFAIQWFIYDAARGDADPFRYYLWWSCYTWGILTPVVVYFAYRNPIKPSTWKRAVPMHLAASYWPDNRLPPAWHRPNQTDLN